MIRAALIGDHRAIKGLGQCPSADINTVDAKGRTPLYLTSWLGHVKATEEILKHKHTRFNKGRGLDGLTPFSIASQKGHVQIMSLLSNHSYHNDEDVNDGWQRDQWTGQYSGVEIEKDTTSMETHSTSDDIPTGLLIL